MYSQYDEERYILEACPERGQFLDVGAFHPRILSNTRALFERGWSGVCVEPSPGPLLDLLPEYGDGERVKVVSAALGYDGGLMKLHVTDGPTSTASDAVRDLWASEQRYLGDCWVPQITFEAVINQFGAFQMVSIDAEGSSVDLLHRLLALPMQPACIVVEHDERAVEVTSLIGRHGYKIAYGNGTNLVLTR